MAGSAIGSCVRRAFVALLAAAAAWGAPALAQPAFWVVKDADSMIYLFGTVHLLKPDTVWKTDKLEAAIAKSETLWLELPTTDQTTLATQMAPLVVRYGLSPDKTLASQLTPAEMKTLDAGARVAGMSGSALNRFRPWYAALVISNAAVLQAGFDATSGVDGKIEAAFRSRGIKPNGFESAEQQIKVFANMGEAEELAYLRETLKEYQNASTEVNKLVTFWAAGDVDGLAEMFMVEAKNESSSFYDALFTDRNAHWTGEIETMLKGKGVVFIAVGAGHLIGEDSVIAMLDAKGIKAERLQ